MQHLRPLAHADQSQPAGVVAAQTNPIVVHDEANLTGVGDRQLHLIEQAGAGRDAAGRISRSDHMAIEVKDLDAVRETLQGAGIEFQNGENAALGFEQVFCSDPDGHTIEFVVYS